MRIGPIGYLDYLIVFEACRSRLSDHYFRSRGNTLQILGAYDEKGWGQGILLYECRGNQTELCYLGVRQPGNGVGTALFNFLAEQEQAEGRKILLRANQNSESGRILSRMAEKRGFVLKDQVELFRAGPEVRPRWKAYMEKHGAAILKLLEEQGFQAVPFTEVGQRLWEQLQDVKSMEFDLSLDPVGVMNGRKGLFNREISYLSLKDGQPAAYCLVCQPDARHYVFEVISAAGRFQDTGVIFQPLALAIDKVVERSGWQVGFAMYQKNRKAMALSGRMMRSVISVRELQYNYEL